MVSRRPAAFDRAAAPVAVGLTVVAFGTGAPEFVVAVTGSLTGAAGVSFGNFVGANIANIALILGATALIKPLAVNATVVTREIPIAGLAILATVVLSFDSALGSGPDRLTRGDGLMLLLLFCVFVYYNVRALRSVERDEFAEAAHKLGWRMRVRTLVLPAGLTAGGLVGLAIGGNRTCHPVRHSSDAGGPVHGPGPGEAVGNRRRHATWTRRPLRFRAAREGAPPERKAGTGADGWLDLPPSRRQAGDAQGTCRSGPRIRVDETWSAY